MSETTVASVQKNCIMYNKTQLHYVLNVHGTEEQGGTVFKAGQMSIWKKWQDDHRSNSHVRVMSYTDQCQEIT